MTASGFTVCDLRQTQIDLRNQHWAPELWPQSPISAPQAINRIMFLTCTLYTAEFMEGVSLTLLSFFWNSVDNFHLSQAARESVYLVMDRYKKTRSCCVMSHDIIFSAPDPCIQDQSLAKKKLRRQILHLKIWKGELSRRRRANLLFQGCGHLAQVEHVPQLLRRLSWFEESNLCINNQHFSHQ